MMRSIRTQMMLFFSLLILIPIIISCVNVYYALQNYLEDSYVRQQSQSINNLADEIDDWRLKQEDLSLQLFGDRAVQQFLRVPNTVQTGEQLQRTVDFRKAVQTYAAQGNPRLSLFVVRTNGTIYGEGLSDSFENYIRQNIPVAADYAGLPVWDNVPDTNRIVLFRQINDNEKNLNQPIGYLFLLFDKAVMEQMFGRYTVDAGQQYAVLDDKESFELSTDSSASKSFVQEVVTASGTSAQSLRQYRGEQYFAFVEQRSGWTLASWIEYSKVLEPARELFFGIVFIAAVLICFSVFMVLFLSHRLTRPLKAIQRKMKQIGEGFFVFKVPVVRNDEVGQLATAMNRMSDEIESLIQKNREEESRRRLLQLQTLEYQINPHFLYNTLDSVNMLARKHKDPVIADMVTYLSRLFRIGLNQGRELISVADEVQHVTYYLKIQEIRFAGQLFWDIQVDESIAHVKMIKFLLQPLVENSINHGIRRRDEPGHIYIRVWQEPDSIVLEVEDDGVGMDSDQLERVRNMLREHIENDEKDHGFGLRNVHQRIQLHYGENYGLELASEKGFGTTVTVRLPNSPVSPYGKTG